MSSPATGWAAILAPRYLAPTATLSLGVALLAFNAFLAATALPSAVVDLGGVTLISWATTVFLVFSIMGGVGAALLKGRLGARRALVAATLVFIAGSVLAAFAGTMPELLAGRALQGLGEGVVAAICYTLIPELFPSALVPKVFGVEAAVWAIAAFGGPALAGFLTETVSWRAAFGINLPLGVLLIAMVLAIVPSGERAQANGAPPLARLVLIGAAIMAVSVGGVIDSPFATLLCLVLAAATLVAVVRRDRAAKVPLFPSRAFRLDDVVGAGLWVILVMPLAQAGSAVFLVYALQNVWGFPPTLAGMTGAVMAISWSSVAMAVAGIGRPATRMALIRLGPVMVAAGLALLAAGIAMELLALVVFSQILIGAGYGVCWAFTSQTVMEAALPGERDRAAGLLPTIQSAGYGIGAAVAGLLANGFGIAAAHTPAALAAVLAPTFLICAILGLPAVAAAIAMTRQAEKRFT